MNRWNTHRRSGRSVPIIPLGREIIARLRKAVRAHTQRKKPARRAPKGSAGWPSSERPPGRADHFAKILTLILTLTPLVSDETAGLIGIKTYSFRTQKQYFSRKITRITNFLRFEPCIVHQHKTSEALGFQGFLFYPLTARQGLGVFCAPGPPMPHLTRRPLFCPISSARHSFPAPKKKRPGVPVGTPGRFDICFSPAQNQAAAGFAGLSSGTGSRRGGDWAPRHRS